MSSSSLSRRDRHAAWAALLVMVACAGQLWAAPAAAAAVPLPALAVLPGQEYVSVVVDAGAGTPRLTASQVQVQLDDVPQQVTLTPVISNRLAVAMVVDASAAGRAALPGWLSAGARFVLETPAAARAAVVADTSPPRVVAAPQSGHIEVVRALSALRPGGERRTSDALTLALQQLPAAPAGPRVVLLYTTAPDAGGEPVQALADRLTRAQAILVVVGNATGSRYWSAVSLATGGLFAPVSAPLVEPALDQVGTLRGRYVLSFPTPDPLPNRLSVRIETADVTLTGEAAIPPVPGIGRSGGPPGGLSIDTVLWAIAATIGLMLLVSAAALRWDRPSRHPAAPADAGVARGRASVPQIRPTDQRPAQR